MQCLFAKGHALGGGPAIHSDEHLPLVHVQQDADARPTAEAGDVEAFAQLDAVGSNGHVLGAFLAHKPHIVVPCALEPFALGVARRHGLHKLVLGDADAQGAVLGQVMQGHFPVPLASRHGGSHVRTHGEAPPSTTHVHCVQHVLEVGIVPYLLLAIFVPDVAEVLCTSCRPDSGHLLWLHRFVIVVQRKSTFLVIAARRHVQVRCRTFRHLDGLKLRRHTVTALH